ncbi:MAG TPA: peptidylprolyl isomerase [Candidatus Binataceae bacterium]|nr:peptidylprolyl isomerase [Candidatus Binataceae bacterium]
MIVAIAAALASAPTVRAQQQQESGLSWQQRFLGILPLVKPDPKDPVVVTVNGTPITLNQVKDYAKTEQRLINANTTEETRAVFKDAMENLISRQLLIDEAERRGIKIPEAELAERAREFQIQGLGGETAPSTGNAPDQILLNQVRGSMEIEKMLDDEFQKHKVAPSEQDIQRYYDEHKDLFVQDPGEVRLSHIALKLPPNATDAQKDAGLKRINALREEAMKTKDFAALAKANSQDATSAAKGGDLGYFTRGQLPPVVDQLAFSTPVGKVSSVLQSSLGFSFLKVTDRRGASYAPITSVKSKIAMVLLDFNQDYIVKGMLKVLAKNAKIKFNKIPGEDQQQQAAQ